MQIADLAKKLFLTGLGAIFLTEETIRGMMGELRMPKELANTVLDGAKRHKDDFIAVLAKEVGTFLKHIKVYEELQKALDGMKINISADITLSHTGQKGTQVTTKIKHHKTSR